jgi:hypothetical protein
MKEVVGVIKIKHEGSFKNTDKFFKRVSMSNYLPLFEKYGRQGVSALSSSTPLDSGETRNSWDYKITRTRKGITITWLNSHVVDGVNIAIILQYGHGTRNGGYVQGRDYINPTIRPIFDKMSLDIWREVSAL